MKKWFLFSLVFMMAANAQEALDVGEAMTVRLLDLSSSKKTVLVNRGLEDGISEDTHAKFFLTTGVVARGVAVKVAPNRSVWSIYRTIYPDEMVRGNVLQLGITRALETTDDPTKAIRHVPSVAGRLPRNYQEQALDDRSNQLNMADVNRVETGSSRPASQQGRGSFYGRAK